MKNFYILAIALFAMVFTGNAQAYDYDFEAFNLGDAVGQVPQIILWPAAGVTSSQITDDEAFSGSQSMVTREQAGGNVDDVLMTLGNQDSGIWSVSWMMYVPAGATGFWNIQNDEGFGSTAEAQWNGQFFIGETASGGTAGLITFDQDADASAPYASDVWFKVVHVLDFDDPDGPTHTLVIDGNTMLDAVAFEETTNVDPSPQLGAINYFAIDAANRFFVDDFVFEAGNILSTDNFDPTNFSVYPNPVQDRLNIQSVSTVDSVMVYDILGKEVLSTTPGVISPSIDMSSLTSGAYLVNITIDGASKTVKVIK